MTRISALLVCVLLLIGCASAPATSPEEPFQREDVQGLGNPEVVVMSQVNRPIKVTLTGPTTQVLTVPAMKSARVQVPPGTYHYRAETKGATAFDGDQQFAADGRYTWSFHIVRSKPIPPVTLIAELNRILQGGPLDGATFEGAKLGGTTLPPEGKPDQGGWTEYPSGWGVMLQGGKVKAFRFGPNVLSDLQLFERPDVEAKYGPPTTTETMDGPNGKITALVYDPLRAAFLVDQEGGVLVLVLE